MGHQEGNLQYITTPGFLNLYPEYQIILDSLSPNQTTIKIESYPMVEIRRLINWDHFIPDGTFPDLVDVKPSTIEEYEIIKTIGDSLGEKNMPPVKRP